MTELKEKKGGERRANLGQFKVNKRTQQDVNAIRIAKFYVGKKKREEIGKIFINS